MTSLHVICGLNPHPIQNPSYAYASNHVRTKFRLLHLCIVTRTFTSGCLQHCKGAKYTLHCFLPESFFFGMGWNMEENFSMEWKKISRMEYGKIIFHTMPCATLHLSTALRVSFMIMHIVC